jgi:hypothetical protein
MLANQASARPTNKALTMFAGFVLTTPQVAPVVNEVWPQIAPAALAGPAATNAVAAIIAGAISLAVAWFVPDRANNPRV